VDFLVEALDKYAFRSVGIYGKMSQMQRRDNFYEVRASLSSNP